MASEFRTVQTRMWREDEWFQSLPTDARLLFIYLFTNPSASVSGIYRLPVRTMAFESGLPEARVLQLLEQFAAAGKVRYTDGVVWVVRMRENQLPGLISPQLAAKIHKDLATIPDCTVKIEYMTHYRYPINTLSIPAPTEQIQYNTDTLTTTTPQPPTDIDSPSSVVGVVVQAQPEQPQADKARGAIIELWEQLAPGSLSPLLAEKIHDMIDCYGADEVVRAIGIARDANKRSAGYVEGILRRRANGEGAPGANGNGGQRTDMEKLRADAKRAQSGIRTSERLGFAPQAHDLAMVEKARKAGAI